MHTSPLACLLVTKGMSGRKESKERVYTIGFQMLNGWFSRVGRVGAPENAKGAPKGAAQGGQ